MSERKVLNKYYPPDFDPSKIPRMKLPKNRQYTVRLMAPFNMRCKTCGEYIYKGKKFNARKEDVENQDYLGIRIYRFYIKCTRCLQEISFKTDPRNCDYEIEAGATRNFMALKLAEEQAQREEDELKEEEANNPMKLLENRTIQSKNEIELLESLEELKDLNKRQQAVDYDSMLSQYDTRLSAREIEERLQQQDEDYIKSVKFHSSNKRKVVVEEEIIEDESSTSHIQTETRSSSSVSESVKQPQNAQGLANTSSETCKKFKSDPGSSDPLIDSSVHQSTETISKKPEQKWNKSVGLMSRKNLLSGLVKVKKPEDDIKPIETVTAESNKDSSNGLSMLGSYSSSESDNE